MEKARAHAAFIRGTLRRTLIFFIAPFIAFSPTPAECLFIDDPFGNLDTLSPSPFESWKVLESPHFKIVFPLPLRSIASQSIEFFEEAHAILAPVLEWEPPKKTPVLLLDNRDLPNGLTSPFAGLGIILWVTPPDSSSGTNVYEDWLKQLIIHEYTHFLNMDATSGIFKPLRFIFRDFLLPNALWPPWMLEGLAVYMETRFTKGGRGRGAYYEMILRSAVEKDVLNTEKWINFDRIHSENPFFPGGNIPYLFGYEFMNQVAQGTAFEKDLLKTAPLPNDALFGKISKSSSHRIPFFINDNFKTTIGKTATQYWSAWVETTQKRMKKQLQKIHSHPLTKTTLLTQADLNHSSFFLGGTASPDGKWLAYTLSSTETPPSLYLYNLLTHETKQIITKQSGAGHCFTKDSQALIYSRLRPSGQFEIWSDLELYSLKTNSTYWLSKGLRLQDPHLTFATNPNQLVFTLSENNRTVLALAPLLYKEGVYALGPIQKLWTPARYDRVGNPQFSHDAKHIYFSFHPNGKSQEDILKWDFLTQKVTTLVSNGKYNRFPILRQQEQTLLENPRQELFFISDLTGVENLYQYHFYSKKIGLVTNFTTGLGFPFFGADSRFLYGGISSYTGSPLAQIELPKKMQEIPIKDLTLSPPPAPPPALHAIQKKEKNKTPYTEKKYSPFSSLLPRFWAPLFGSNLGGVSVGAQVFGFDSIHLHQYTLGASYLTNLSVAEAYARYSTRKLGPKVSFSANIMTLYPQLFSQGTLFDRLQNFAIGLSYPIFWSISQLDAYLGYSLNRFQTYFKPNHRPSVILDQNSRTIFAYDAVIRYSQHQSSALAVSPLFPETGEKITLGARHFTLFQESSWKALLIADSYIKIPPHSVLNPFLKLTFSSNTISTYMPANGVLQGRSPLTIFNPFPGDYFNQLTIRGYPNKILFSEKVGVGGINILFPIARIFRGWGTCPTFLKNLYGIHFLELSYKSQTPTLLPSIGTGLRLSTQISILPFAFSLEYHKGLRRDEGGVDDFFFQILTEAFNF